MGRPTKDNRENDPGYLKLRAYILLIKANRIEKGLSQVAVAAAMGTTQSAVSDIENQEVDPQFSTFMRYANACGVSVNVSIEIKKDEHA